MFTTKTFGGPINLGHLLCRPRTATTNRMSNVRLHHHQVVDGAFKQMETVAE